MYVTSLPWLPQSMQSVCHTAQTRFHPLYLCTYTHIHHVRDSVALSVQSMCHPLCLCNTPSECLTLTLSLCVYVCHPEAPSTLSLHVHTGLLAPLFLLSYPTALPYVHTLSLCAYSLCQSFSRSLALPFSLTSSQACPAILP